MTTILIESAQRIRAMVGKAVTTITQADEVIAPVRLFCARVLTEPFFVVNVQPRAVMLAAFIAASVLILNDAQAQHAPALTPVFDVGASPIGRHRPPVRTLVFEMTGDRAEARRITAVLRSPLNLVGFQAERAAALNASELDWFLPFRIGAATAALRREPSGAMRYLLAVDHLGSDGCLPLTRARTVARSIDAAFLDEHGRAAMCALPLNSRVSHLAILLPIEVD